jgi:chorismate mutase
MGCRGIRGAITVEANDSGAILAATKELLSQIREANHLDIEDIGSVIFTATTDLDAVYPARAAREMGWVDTPLLCMQEMVVAGSLPRCIRVLVLWNTDRPADQIRHVFLGEAGALRPDLIKAEETQSNA